MNSETMEMMGYNRVYDYTQYSHDNDVNVIPEDDFKRLVSDTFKVIADNLRRTYGPYGSNVSMTEDNGDMITTKDGYNTFCALGFSHQYKRMVYLAIKKIIERVNQNVGDGTTSCILMAEKIFNNLSESAKNPENKRNIMDVLNFIEKDFQRDDKIKADKELGLIHPVTMSSFKNLISVSGNYDKELTDVLMEAFDPQTEDTVTGVVSRVRNVIPDSEVDYSPDVKATFTVDRMPGNYRVRINMDNEFGLSLSQPTKVKMVIYDHAFNTTDWLNFMRTYDKSSEMITVIMARTFMRDFMDTEYVKYLSNLRLTKQPVRVYLCEVKGKYVRDEIKDLSALLDADINTMQSIKPIDFEQVPQPLIQVYNGDCMCFFLNDEDVPIRYIENLKKEYRTNTADSFVQKKIIGDRIKALSLQNEDTLVTVKGSSSLEVKLIMDKIDDCTSIVQSAMYNGIVSNMFRYAYYRLSSIDIQDNDMTGIVVSSMMNAIRDLSTDIYRSKHGDDAPEITGGMDPKYSFNIFTEKECDVCEIPTSTQYDLEVISAAISIVKYLLSSNAYIFNAHLLQMSGDRGHYEMK